MEGRCFVDVQTRCDISRTVEDTGEVTIECYQKVIYAASTGTTTDVLD